MATNEENMPDISDTTLSSDDEVPLNMADQMGGQDLMALFVLDDIPNKTLNTILENNAKLVHGDITLWLADSYDTIPDYHGSAQPGTDTPIDPNWRSPFIGKTIPDAIAFLRNTPKPPKPLNKVYCAVLTQESLDDQVVYLCRNLEGDTSIEMDIEELSEEGHRNLRQVYRELGHDYENVQVIPTDMETISEFHYTFEEWKWPGCYIEWREDGVGYG